VTFSFRRAWLLIPSLLVAFAAAAELAARLDDLMRYDVPFFAAPLAGYDLIVRDSATIRGRPYGRFEKIQLNAAGFRGPPITPVPAAGCIRVMVLGSSESIVGGEEAGTEYPARMQQALDRRGCFEVQNAAVSGLNIGRITLLWNDWAARWSPNVVVIYPSPAFYLLPEGPDYPTRALPQVRPPAWWTPRIAARLSGQSFWPDFLAKRSLRRDIARKVAGQRRGWEYRAVPGSRLALYQGHLDSLVVAVEASGAEAVLVTHANRFPDPPAGEDELLLLGWARDSRARPRVILDFEHAANAAMVAVARRRDAMLVDAAGRMSGRREWFTDFSHFTREGRAVLGDLVADSVAALVARRAADGDGTSP